MTHDTADAAGCSFALIITMSLLQCNYIGLYCKNNDAHHSPFLCQCYENVCEIYSWILLFCPVTNGYDVTWQGQ